MNMDIVTSLILAGACLVLAGACLVLAWYLRSKL